MSTIPDTVTDQRPPVAIVVAMTRAGVIGRDGHLPWDLPEDRRLFRQLTVGHTVIMGRRTFASLPAPLPDRHNIVVSRTLRHCPGAITVQSFVEGLALGRQLGGKIFVIGGVELYRQALPLADTLYISWIEDDCPGDSCFPTLDLSGWEIVATSAHAGFQHAVYRRQAGLRP